MATSGGQKASLLSLPSELKNQIYRFACVDEKVILEKERKKPCSNDHTYRMLRPGIIVACRETYRDARPIYYQENFFYFMDDFFSSPGAITTFERLCGKYANSITNVCVARFGWGVGHRFFTPTRFHVSLTPQGLQVSMKSGCAVIEQHSRNIPYSELGHTCGSNILNIAKIHQHRLPPQMDTGEARNPIFVFLEHYARDLRDITVPCERVHPQDMTGIFLGCCEVCLRVYFIKPRLSAEPEALTDKRIIEELL